jgi:thiamine-phosphate diphosphorylase
VSLPDRSLHLVTSRLRLSPEARTLRAELAALEAMIDDAIDAGVDVVQVRERDLPAGVLLGLVSRLRSRAASGSTRVIVNDRSDVAAAAGADGVHLPSHGVSAVRLRRIEPAWVLGRSIHGAERPADCAACDYLLYGTVFPSASKSSGSPVAGLDGLRIAVNATGRPVVAIGGITPPRVRDCLDAGAGTGSQSTSTRPSWNAWSARSA